MARFVAVALAESDLFAVIGTTYGAGNGTTTFNVPNLKGRVPVGRDSGQAEFDVLGETGGAKTHTLSIAEMPSHGHNIRYGYPAGGDGSGVAYSGTAGITTSPLQVTAMGDSGPHNNLQPYVVLNAIVKT